MWANKKEAQVLAAMVVSFFYLANGYSRTSTQMKRVHDLFHACFWEEKPR